MLGVEQLLESSEIFGALTRQEKFMYAHGAGEAGEVILGESGA